MRLVRNLSFKGFQSCVLDREACCPPVPQLIDRALVSLSPVWFLDELEGLAYSRSQNCHCKLADGFFLIASHDKEKYIA
jgi:hypothetical protein